MAAVYKVIVTQNGLDKLEQAMAQGYKLVITEMRFGDAYGEEYVPTVDQLDLKHTILRKEVSEAVVSEGLCKYKSVLLSTDPTGTFLELGLFLDDGSMFAIANIPRLEHVQSLSGSVSETEVSMILAAENADNITINVSSAVYVAKEYADTYYIRTDGNNTILENIDMNQHKLTGLKNGTLSSDAATLEQTLDIASIYLYAGIDTPWHSLECDGQSYSRLGDTQELYKRVGTLYGKGDGTLTFNVPNIPAPFEEYPTIRYLIKYKK